jgi:hypothetical protein
MENKPDTDTSDFIRSAIDAAPLFLIALILLALSACSPRPVIVLGEDPPMQTQGGDGGGGDPPPEEER